MKRTFLLTVLGMAMALTTSAQIKQDAGGMKSLKQTLTYNDGTYKAPVKGEAAIAELLGMTQSAISHQLKVLRDNKLVASRRAGKTIYYSLADDHVRTIIGQGFEHLTEHDHHEACQHNISKEES